MGQEQDAISSEELCPVKRASIFAAICYEAVDKEAHQTETHL